MTQVIEQPAHDYELSYTPTNKKYDAKFGRIKLTMAGDKRLHLNHRSGYFAVGADQTRSGSRDASPASAWHGGMKFRVASFAQDAVVQTSIGSHAKGGLSFTAYQDR